MDKGQATTIAASPSASLARARPEKRRLTRWHASGAHLLISAAIAAAVLTLMLTVWYPPPLFEAAGGNDLALILIGVDVVIGPLLTLIVFKPGKRGLRFDLAAIAVFQLAAARAGQRERNSGVFNQAMHRIEKPRNFLNLIDDDPNEAVAACEHSALELHGATVEQILIFQIQQIDPQGIRTFEGLS